MRQPRRGGRSRAGNRACQAHVGSVVVGCAEPLFGADAVSARPGSACSRESGLSALRGRLHGAGRACYRRDVLGQRHQRVAAGAAVRRFEDASQSARRIVSGPHIGPCPPRCLADGSVPGTCGPAHRPLANGVRRAERDVLEAAYQRGVSSAAHDERARGGEAGERGLRDGDRERTARGGDQASDLRGMDLPSAARDGVARSRRSLGARAPKRRRPGGRRRGRRRSAEAPARRPGRCRALRAHERLDGGPDAVGLTAALRHAGLAQGRRLTDHRPVDDPGLGGASRRGSNGPIGVP